MEMRDLWTNRVLSILGPVLLLGLALSSPSYYLNAAEDDCARTSKMRVYSSAFIAAGSGDLDGYELALSQTSDSKVDALLFVYEGAADGGIPLSGRISDGNMIIDGVWTEHQIESPSRKEVVQTHSIKILGALDPSWFRGRMKIEGLLTPEKIRLKRVPRIWACRK